MTARMIRVRGGSVNMTLSSIHTPDIHLIDNNFFFGSLRRRSAIKHHCRRYHNKSGIRLPEKVLVPRAVRVRRRSRSQNTAQIPARPAVAAPAAVSTTHSGTPARKHIATLAVGEVIDIAGGDGDVEVRKHECTAVGEGPGFEPCGPFRRGSLEQLLRDGFKARRGKVRPVHKRVGFFQRDPAIRGNLL